ncbi:MAG: hypothetical protein LV480_12160 [Methylacidiphilales bacterium]|nr:hypothetical protein [Candidatus Methylacidiphilales bacterium]
MSMTEILDELPKLSSEERQLLARRLSELEVGGMESTQEILAAIDEARAKPSTTDVSAEELSRDVIRWARTK